MSKHPFQQFINPKNNAAVKEKFKQDKKKAKKQRAVDIEKHFEEKRAARTRGFENKPPEVKPDKRQKYPQKKLSPAGKTNPTTPGAAPAEKKKVIEGEMPLNKFLAHCGIASRREAVSLIIAGKVIVNKNLITQPAFKVNEKDDVFYNGKKISVTKNLVYILLNKPKDYITTTSDPQNRKTVLQLTKAATDKRIYPVGRLVFVLKPV